MVQLGVNGTMIAVRLSIAVYPSVYRMSVIRLPSACCASVIVICPSDSCHARISVSPSVIICSFVPDICPSVRRPPYDHPSTVTPVIPRSKFPVRYSPSVIPRPLFPVRYSRPLFPVRYSSSVIPRPLFPVRYSPPIHQLL